MRACDLYREIQDLNASNIDGPKRRRITLRYLNRLKNQKKRRERERAAKIPFLARMYGDPILQADAVESELAREQERHEIEMLKQELELLKDQIAVQIDGAEIDTEQRGRIAQGALRAIARTQPN